MFSQAIKADPGDYRPHLHLANYRLAMGDTAGAVESFKRVLSFPEARFDDEYLRLQRGVPDGRK